MFGRTKANTTCPVESPYRYVDREETIKLDDLCNTGGYPVIFAIATFAIIFFVALELYKKKLDFLAKDALKNEKLTNGQKKKKKLQIISQRSLTKGGYLEETFLAPFAPSSMETLAAYVFFIWFVTTASFGVTRVYAGKWANNNSFQQYPFNVVSFLFGCPGLDPYAVSYTPSWKEATPKDFDEDNPFDWSFFDMLRSKGVINAMVTLIPIFLTFAKRIGNDTEPWKGSVKVEFIIIIFSCLAIFMQFLNVQKFPTAKLMAFEFFFSQHMVMGIGWLCFGFYQIYHARHGWVHKTGMENEIADDMKRARHHAHRLFGRLVAVPFLSLHLLLAYVMASRNPANQNKLAQANYFTAVAFALSGAITGISHAVNARSTQKEIDEKLEERKRAEIEEEQAELKKELESDILTLPLPPESKQKVKKMIANSKINGGVIVEKSMAELDEEIEEKKKLRDWYRNNHMVKMFQTWVFALAGSGSVRIAIWFLWTISKFLEPQLRKRIERGYCIDSAFREGDTEDIGDSSTCLAPVYLNLLFMGVIMDWVYCLLLRTDTVEDARARYEHDYPEVDCFEGEKKEAISNLTLSIFQAVFFFFLVLFVDPNKNEKKIEVCIVLFAVHLAIKSLHTYATKYITLYGTKEQDNEPTLAKIERKIVIFVLYAFMHSKHEAAPLVKKAAVGSLHIQN